MKFKKISILLLSTIIISSFFVGCSKEDNPASKKWFGDRSDQMAQVPLGDSQFDLAVVQKLSAISQEGYDLKTQAIAIMDGRLDRNIEIPKIEKMLTNIVSARDYFSDLYVAEHKQSIQENLIVALDNYSIQLTDYKNLLTQNNINKNDVQMQIDQVMGALNMIKQYSK